MRNITFIFEISPNTKPKEKKVWGHGILCPPRLKKWGGHVPRQIAPMPLVSTINCSLASQALLEITHQHHSIGITLLLLVRATYI